MPQERVPLKRDDAHERAEKYSKPAEKQPTHRHRNTTNTQEKQKRSKRHRNPRVHGTPTPRDKTKNPERTIGKQKTFRQPEQLHTPEEDTSGSTQKLADTNFASQ
ncbi:MAG: hypothetical protein ACTSRF_14995 [Candidatus Freyarchaeota archaeon]